MRFCMFGITGKGWTFGRVLYIIIIFYLPPCHLFVLCSLFVLQLHLSVSWLQVSVYSTHSSSIRLKSSYSETTGSVITITVKSLVFPPSWPLYKQVRLVWHDYSCCEWHLATTSVYRLNTFYN